MAKVLQVTCDVCGAEKKEVNHWFQVHVRISWMIQSWVDGQEGWKDVCGQECAAKLLQKWMATGSLEG